MTELKLLLSKDKLTAITQFEGGALKTYKHEHFDLVLVDVILEIMRKEPTYLIFVDDNINLSLLENLVKLGISFNGTTNELKYNEEMKSQWNVM